MLTFKNAVFISREDVKNETDCKKLVGTGARFWNLNNKSQCSGNFNMQYLLPNGMYINLYLESPCSVSSSGEEVVRANGGSMTRYCGDVWLDVNGKKGPNQWGRDGYSFLISNTGKIEPWGGREHLMSSGVFDKGQIKNYSVDRCDPNSTSTASQYTGKVCAARVMEVDNWEMKY